MTYRTLKICFSSRHAQNWWDVVTNPQQTNAAHLGRDSNKLLSILIHTTFAFHFRDIYVYLNEIYETERKKVEIKEHCVWILPFQSVLDRHIGGNSNSNAPCQRRPRRRRWGRGQTNSEATSALPSGIDCCSFQAALHAWMSAFCVPNLGGENVKGETSSWKRQGSVAPLPRVQGPRRSRGQDDLQGQLDLKIWWKINFYLFIGPTPTCTWPIP